MLVGCQEWIRAEGVPSANEKTRQVADAVQAEVRRRPETSGVCENCGGSCRFLSGTCLFSCFYFRFVLPLLRHQTGIDRDVTMMAILNFSNFK